MKFLMKANLFLTHKVNKFLKHYSEASVPQEEIVISREVPADHSSKDRRRVVEPYCFTFVIH